MTTPLATTEAVAPLGNGARPHTDGGWGVIPIQTRSERFTSTDVEAFDAVTGREAVWKLTPVRRLDDLISGELDGSRYSVTSSEAAGTSVSWIPRDDARVGAAGAPEDRAQRPKKIN